MSLWTEKYKPKTIDDILGNTVAIERAQRWIENFKNSVPGTPHALFLAGPPGIGKTTLATLLLQSFDYDVLEFNASDIRNQKLVREKLKSILGKVSISSMMGITRYCGIIMDEVDGMSSGDKGGVSELVSFINPNKGKRKKDHQKIPYTNPIICICNEDGDKKIQDLKKVSEYIRFQLPKMCELYQYAEKIIQQEKIRVDEDKLLDIIKYSQQDVRKMIGNLEYLQTGGKTKLCEDFTGLDKKLEDKCLFDSVFQVMDTYPGLSKIIQVCEKDKGLINLLVHENLLNFMSNYRNKDLKKLLVLQKIYQLMSQSDMIDSYLYNNYHPNICEINTILRCGGTSFLLNEQKRVSTPVFVPQNIVFSKLLSRFSVQHQNYKTQMILNHKLLLSCHPSSSWEIYFTILQLIITSVNKKKLESKLEKWISKYDLKIEDFEKISKLVKIKVRRTAREDELSKMAKTELDKKYFIKFQKMFLI